MIDKRRIQLSSLIVSGPLSREAALAEAARPLITEREAEMTIRLVAKKLGISPRELSDLIENPPVSHRAYPSNGKRNPTSIRPGGWLRSRRAGARRPGTTP